MALWNKISLTTCRISQSSTSRGAPYALRQLSGCAIAGGNFVLVHFSFLHPTSPIQPTRAPPSAGVQQPCAMQPGRDWRRADKPHYVGLREGGRWTPRDVGVSVPLDRLDITEGLVDDEDQSFLPTRPFFSRRILAAWTPLIEYLRLTDLCASSGPFVNSDSSRESFVDLISAILK